MGPVAVAAGVVTVVRSPQAVAVGAPQAAWQVGCASSVLRGSLGTGETCWPSSHCADTHRAWPPLLCLSEEASLWPVVVAAPRPFTPSLQITARCPDRAAAPLHLTGCRFCCGEMFLLPPSGRWWAYTRSDPFFSSAPLPSSK